MRSGGPPTAITLVQITALVQEGGLIEIEADAVLKKRS
jgi:hypothetical protein